ncbi:hypothetical protein [Bradyrhizobium sp. STM 3562]|uniref:hypothetical protein n=1 Tax=Bradyrhizobium sp. STM 3562 TaxID=578924 RepID=UPI00388DFD4D
MSSDEMGPHEFAEPPEDSLWNRRAREEREHLDRWRAFMAQPWTPDAVTPEALNQLQEQSIIWLDDAIDLMAFGLGACPLDPIERAARRAPATRAFCEAARLGKFALYGSRNAGSDDGQQIPTRYFDFPRRLGGREPSRVLELDLADISDDRVFDDDHAGRRTKWFDVRIDQPGSFFEWLRGQAPAKTPERSTLEQVEATYLQRIQEHRGKKNPSRDEDVKWLQQKFGIDRTTARDIRKRLAPPEWQDPGAPRKK